jgi:glutathione S-transferase
MIRVWTIPFSTNVERVSLALAHKGLEAESVPIAPDARGELERVSGQALVPVVDFDGAIVADSVAILRRLEELHPDPPLWPEGRSERAEVDVFIDWFNRVWKVAPNMIAAELERQPPDQFVLDEQCAELETHLDLFEGLLEGRSYLLGGCASAADFVAFPFLKYGVGRDPEDDELFHRVLEQYQPLGDGRPNLRAWIERIDGHPRAF